MTTYGIGPAAPLAGNWEASVASKATVKAPSFEHWFTSELGALNTEIKGAEQSLVQLAAGEGNLHAVMIELEQAKTAFQLAVQVRNKVLEAYQDLVRMQI